MVACFASAFLDSPVKSSSEAVSRLFQEASVPQQKNGIDCGVMVFAFAVHAIASRSLLAAISMRMWRPILLTMCDDQRDIVDLAEVSLRRYDQPAIERLRVPSDLVASDILRRLLNWHRMQNEEQVARAAGQSAS